MALMRPLRVTECLVTGFQELSELPFFPFYNLYALMNAAVVK